MNFSIIRSIGLLFVIAGILISCENKSELVTKSGLKVQLVKKGGDTAPIKNGVATLNMKFETEDGRLLFDSDKRGGAVPVRTTDEDKGLLDEVVDILKVGDSVAFTIPAEDLFEKTYNMTLPDSIERGTKLLFNLGMENTFTMTAYEAIVEEQNEKRIAKWVADGTEQLKADIATIDEWLDKEGKEYIKLESGIRIVMKEDGKGEKPQIGNHINVHYEGRYFSTGELFEQSNKEADPFVFTLGSGVISGWSLGFAELKEGAKATLYIPSGLGYGQVQNGPIPANSILVFDVDFVRIEK